MHTSCILKTMVKIQIKISRKVVLDYLLFLQCNYLEVQYYHRLSAQNLSRHLISIRYHPILMENKQVYGIRNITSSLYYISTKQFSLLLCCLKVPKSHPILFFTLLPCPAFDRVMQFGANGDQQKQIKSFNFLQWRSTHSSKHNVSS